MTRTLRRTIAALTLTAAALLAGGCTPAQVGLFRAVTAEHADVLSDDQLYALRRCESGDDYSVVSARGTFHGAYQFTVRTWDDLAARTYPWLEGRDPASVEPWWQDAMARALYAERGREPWPVCGRRL